MRLIDFLWGVLLILPLYGAAAIMILMWDEVIAPRLRRLRRWRRR